MHSCRLHTCVILEADPPCLMYLLECQVWPGAVHYPDFLNPATAVYWEAELSAFSALAPWDGAAPPQPQPCYPIKEFVDDPREMCYANL